MHTRVMLVDPDPATLAASGSVLCTAGFTVVAQIESEDAALAQVAAARPDVVVIDMDLPGSVDLAHRIREVATHRPEIIAVAAFAQAGRLGQMVAAGAGAYVVKGKPAELVGAVRAVGAGSGLLSAEASRPVLEEVQKLYQRERERNIELERSVAQMQTLSAIDWLTGLKIHGYFFDRLSEELERSRRYEHPLSVAVADLDGFRAVNDVYGHAAGDSVLRSVGTVILREMREVDVACRLGGEEFGVIMPETGLAGAIRACERLRRATAEMAVPGVGAVTMSVGVAVFPDHAGGRDDLVDLAYAALARAKAQGRNRVDVAGGAVTAPAAAEPDQSEPAARALLSALRTRERTLADHSERVADLTVGLGVRVGITGRRLGRLRSAALLHDVGRLALPDSVLSGAGPLSHADWELIRRHPRVAYEMIAPLVHPAVAAAVLTHHEHLDGSGYPNGLEAGEIPDLARIILICDAFDAMTSERPHRAPMPMGAALRELEVNAGTVFDPRLVEEFASLMRGEGGELVRFPMVRAG